MSKEADLYVLVCEKPKMHPDHSINLLRVPEATQQLRNKGITLEVNPRTHSYTVKHGVGDGFESIPRYFGNSCNVFRERVGSMGSNFTVGVYDGTDVVQMQQMVNQAIHHKSLHHARDLSVDE